MPAPEAAVGGNTSCVFRVLSFGMTQDHWRLVEAGVRDRLDCQSGLHNFHLRFFKSLSGEEGGDGLELLQVYLVPRRRDYLAKIGPGLKRGALPWIGIKPFRSFHTDLKPSYLLTAEV
jgi:hypothetical protein